ncbi:MAG: metal ABC transporter permease [Deltaproteobacteria bacterium]|nr:metal ABC transporter permease [Deltaproteobacteria bacterium]
MLEALTLPFFQRVLLAGLLASVACGVIGTYVVAKRIASLSGGLSHAAFGGVGLGYLAGFPPMLGAAGFGLLAALVVGIAQRRLGSGIDTLVSMVWSVGMALGIVFVALAPGYAPDLMSYLFGSLLFVPWDYVIAIGVLDLLILVAVLRFHRVFEAVCFDDEFAEVAGLPAEGFFLGLLALTALAIVTLIRVVGVILAIALLTIPAATARPWVESLRAMMLLSVALCAVSTVGGLLLAYGLSQSIGLSAPPGPLIILLAAFFYVLSEAARAATRRRPVAVTPAAS